jgi:hypothetical protein
VLDAFEALFFNVRGHLDALDWILRHAIGHKVAPGIAIPDSGVVLKSFAYHGGARVLDAVLPYLMRGQDLFNPPLDLSTVEGRREQAVRLAVAAHLLPWDSATDQNLQKSCCSCTNASTNGRSPCAGGTRG